MGPKCGTESYHCYFVLPRICSATFPILFALVVRSEPESPCFCQAGATESQEAVEVRLASVSGETSIGVSQHWWQKFEWCVGKERGGLRSEHQFCLWLPVTCGRVRANWENTPLPFLLPLAYPVLSIVKGLKWGKKKKIWAMKWKVYSTQLREWQFKSNGIV